VAEPRRAARLGPEFDRERAEVLGGDWAGGLDAGTAAGHLAGLPPERFASVALAGGRGRPLIQPRGGFPGFAEQRALMLAFDEAGADLLPLTIDSHTRRNDYARAATLLAQGEAEGHDLLNGYPLVCHGHERSRELFAGLDRPVSLRHGTPDARLLAEVALATGITEVEGGGLTYCLPYAPSFPVERSIACWRYVDRLCAAASAPGRPVHRESFGPLTATMVPPVMTIVVELCELLLAAEQGVASFGVSFGQTGSVEQDIATAAVLRRKAAEYLARFDLPDVRVVLTYHQWMGAFPADAARAWQVIALGTTIARLVAADKVVVKTTDEALGIPMAANSAEAVRAVRFGLDMLAGLEGLGSARSAAEERLISSEVDTVMAQVLARGGDGFGASVAGAVADGVIDVPFAPHRQNAGRLVTVRDARHAVRVLDPGSVPLTPADLAAERAYLAADAGDGPLWERLLRDVALLS
jgi:methylaspartate mutase epsilon subunit